MDSVIRFWRNLVHIQKTAPEMATVYLAIDGPG